jgi:peptide deformylase
VRTHSSSGRIVTLLPLGLFAPDDPSFISESNQNKETAMETLHRYSLRLRPISLADKCLKPATTTPIFRKTRIHNAVPGFPNPKPPFNSTFTAWKPYSSESTSVARAGWLLGLGEKKKVSLPDIVKAGDPVLHEPAREVEVGEIGSDRIQNIIDDMVKVMRKAPGVGLAAPQIGIPLRVSFEFYF